MNTAVAKIDLETMLARYANEPRSWVCPVHEFAYGDGIPDQRMGDHRH
ncbi:MAG: hypothetical protein QM769_01875 [Pseudoxanthomonas sp.]